MKIMPRDYCTTNDIIYSNNECSAKVNVREFDTAPTPNRMNKIREITITQLDYGYNVRVGCKIFALDTPDKILFALKQYFRNPENIEHQFNKGTLKFEK